MGSCEVSFHDLQCLVAPEGKGVRALAGRWGPQIATSRLEDGLDTAMTGMAREGIQQQAAF
jgi:hypothetical protein